MWCTCAPFTRNVCKCRVYPTYIVLYCIFKIFIDGDFADAHWHCLTSKINVKRTNELCRHWRHRRRRCHCRCRCRPNAMHANDTKCFWQFISVKQKYLSNVIKLKIEHSLDLLGIESRWDSFRLCTTTIGDVTSEQYTYFYSLSFVVSLRMENFCVFIIIILIMFMCTLNAVLTIPSISWCEQHRNHYSNATSAQQSIKSKLENVWSDYGQFGWHANQ